MKSNPSLVMRHNPRTAKIANDKARKQKAGQFLGMEKLPGRIRVGRAGGALTASL
jgi:hypothetical protein